MKAILLAFLLQLEAVGAADPSLFEMRVLAAVHGPVYSALVEGRTDAALPARFGLASPAAEKQLRTALETFIGQTRAAPEYVGATTMDARLDLLFNDAVITPDGHAFDDYFAFAGN
ncbi:MAG: hypothetical protein ACLGHG_01825 [Gammaproteobacteria bacterium]